MKQLLTKLAAAKLEIKETKLKKEGKNAYSNYDYFTPSKIEFLVAQACHNNHLLTTFDLKRNELGEYGELSIWDLETGNRLITSMATAIPEIKATNVAQQLGGCMTYTERYLKTSAFGITDNDLDFDTTENTKTTAKTLKETKQAKQPKQTQEVDMKADVITFLSNNAGASEYYGNKYGINTIDAYTEEQYVEIYNSLKTNKKI